MKKTIKRLTLSLHFSYRDKRTRCTKNLIKTYGLLVLNLNGIIALNTIAHSHT